MTLHAIIFYILAIVILGSTGLAITRRNLVHAVIYLIFSFFGSAFMFYLFGAPLLAVLEIIIYAGAIMILFLFIIMMVKMDSAKEHMFPLKQWLPAVVIGLIYTVLGALIVSADPDFMITLKAALAAPGEFAQYLFAKH